MKKKIALVGIAIGVLLVLNGLGINIPNTYIYGPQEYVGGDAYNYMVEASVRGGKIAATTISKAVYIVGGFMILTFSTFKFVNEKEKEKCLKTKELEQLEIYVDSQIL